MKLADPRKQEEAESKSERAGVRSVSVWADNLGNHMPPTTFTSNRLDSIYTYLRYLPNILTLISIPYLM